MGPETSPYRLRESPVSEVSEERPLESLVNVRESSRRNHTNFWLVNYDELLIGGFKHEWMIFHFIYWGCHPNPIDELMNHHF